LDERSALADVLRVVGEKRVQLFVFDLELDWYADVLATVVFHERQGAFTLGRHEQSFHRKVFLIRLSILANRRFLACAAALGALAAWLSFVPLFGLLGYEFSLALSVAA